MKTIPTPPLLKMRTIISEDGRWARFFLLFTSGQNTAFAIPFSKIGLFLNAVKNVIRSMADRIAARGAFSTEEVAEGLSEPVPVKGVQSGRDDETGEKLLWVETTDSGAREGRRITADDILRAAGTAVQLDCTPVGNTPLLKSVVLPVVRQAEEALSAELARINVEDLAQSAGELGRSAAE